MDDEDENILTMAYHARIAQIAREAQQYSQQQQQQQQQPSPLSRAQQPSLGYYGYPAQQQANETSLSAYAHHPADHALGSESALERMLRERAEQQQRVAAAAALATAANAHQQLSQQRYNPGGVMAIGEEKRKHAAAFVPPRGHGGYPEQQAWQHQASGHHHHLGQESMEHNHASSRKRKAVPAPPVTVSSKPRKVARMPAVGRPKQRKHKRSPRDQDVNKSTNLAGKFVTGILSGKLLTLERATNKQKAIDNMILCGTGHSKQTAPASMTFPPRTITLDRQQMGELADGFLDDRNKAVSEAVRIAYLELKSKHEQLLLTTTSRSESHLEVETLRTQKMALEKQVEKMKAQHKRELKTLQDELEYLQHRKGRSIKAYVTASIHSLRLLRSNHVAEKETDASV